MRVGIIGGADKNQARYYELAESADSSVEFHDGYMDGRAGDALESLVARCDVIVIVTRVNSHTAVRRARELSRKHNRKPLIVRRFGLAHFQAVLHGEAYGLTAHAA